MFATIVQVVLSNDVDKITSVFSLKPQDHFTIMDGATVTLTNTSGNTAALSLVSAFRTGRPDPNTIYRNTHIYSMTLLPSQPDMLYVADGNNVICVGDYYKRPAKSTHPVQPHAEPPQRRTSVY